MPDDDDDSSFSVSDLETQFVSQVGDDKDVWAVNAILKERKRHYLVDWVGEDPETGKPWPPSWVGKHDCTDYLVMQWKKEKVKAKKEATEKKRRAKASKAKAKSKARVKPSTSDEPRERSSSRTSSTVTRNTTTGNPPNSVSTGTSPSMPGPSRLRQSITKSPPRADPLPSGRKRVRSPVTQASPAADDSGDAQSPPQKRPRRRRNLEVDSDSDGHELEAVNRPKSKKVVAFEEEEEVEVEEVEELSAEEEHRARPSKLQQSNVPTWSSKGVQPSTASPAPQPSVPMSAKGKGKARARSSPTERTQAPVSTKVGPPRGVRKDAIRGRVVTSSSTSAAGNGTSRPARSPIPDLAPISSKPKLPQAALDAKQKPKRPVHPLAEEEEEESQTQPVLEPHVPDLPSPDRGSELDDNDEDYDPNPFDGAIDYPPFEYPPVGSDTAPPSPAPASPRISPLRNELPSATRRSRSSQSTPPVPEQEAEPLIPLDPALPPHASPSRRRREPLVLSSPARRAEDDSIIPETTQDTQESSQTDRSPVRPYRVGTPPRRTGSLAGRMRDRTGSLSPVKSASMPDISSKAKALVTSADGGDGLPSYPAAAARSAEVNEIPQVQPKKVLKPIPVITPSKFRPYLRAREPSPSVIDQFSSPEKESEPSKSREVVEEWSPKPGPRLSSPMMQHRGRELAEAAARERRQAREPTRRLPLKSVVRFANGDGRGVVHPDPPVAEVQPLSIHIPDKPVAVDPDDAAMQELEDSYLDLNGGQGQPGFQDGEIIEEHEEASVEAALSQGMDFVLETGAAGVTTSESSQSFDISDSMEVSPSVDGPSQPSAAQSNAERLQTALALLKTKSEEHERLLEELEHARATVAARDRELLEPRPQEIATIQALTADLDLARARINALNADAAAGEMLSQSQSREERFEQERVTWIEERAAWTKERERLQRELVAEQTRATSAEKDRDFFREQHALVKGFADGVTDEVVALRESEAIARGQATDGVQLIRSTFEGRLRETARQRRELKNLNAILVEKDRRTDDEVRRRAASVPELEIERDKWEARAVLADRKAAHFEREAARLTELVEMIDDGSYQGSDAEPTPIPQEGPRQNKASDPEEEEVYRCLVREGRSKTACNALFEDQKGLGSHIIEEHSY